MKNLLLMNKINDLNLKEWKNYLEDISLDALWVSSDKNLKKY